MLWVTGEICVNGKVNGSAVEILYTINNITTNIVPFVDTSLDKVKVQQQGWAKNKDPRRLSCLKAAIIVKNSHQLMQIYFMPTLFTCYMVTPVWILLISSWSCLLNLHFISTNRARSRIFSKWDNNCSNCFHIRILIRKQLNSSFKTKTTHFFFGLCTCHDGL